MPAQTMAALEFRILGPLAAYHGGAPLALGGERQRALLAVLLVHPNEHVSTERLIDQLFGGSAPRSAGNAVRVAVSRLRQALGDDHASVVLTRRGGYLLSVDPEQLDAAVFERLLDEGRGLLASGDAAGAQTRLREALSLWRGRPLGDLTSVEDVHREIGRLEELRLLAEMERIDAELALGRASAAVVDLERLIASEPLQERLRGQLMLALYRSGRQADALAAYREACSFLLDELGLRPSPALRELEGMILRHDPGLKAPDKRSEPLVCPFKGLAAFESADAEFFCGRDRTISELIARLAEWPLVGIIGPSGIGKSSLLRAGVLPALRAGWLPGSATWRQVLLRPGKHPCAELQRTLRPVVHSLDEHERLLVAIDQLEELFTLCDDELERREFLEELVRAAGDNQRRTLVLCALRADFYGRISAYPEFAELLSRSHALVGPIGRQELREVIERPAIRAGIEVERALVELLVAEVADEPGGLPLLSTTLLELWQARDGRTLRLERYHATGGVRSGVARMAEAAYSRLSLDEQRVARRLLLRLADLSAEAPVRRPVALEEVERIDGGADVLLALAGARLLTVGTGMVEISHEALLREWPRYRGWLEEDRVGRRVHAHMRVHAEEWDARGRDRGDLYRGARLAAALEFCVQHRDDMDRLEREYVEASRTEADRETRRQRSQNRRLRLLLAGVAVLLIVSVLAGTIALIRQHQANVDARLAETAANTALGRQLGAEALSEPRLDVAAILAREALALDRSPQTEGTLFSTLLRSPAVVATFSLPTSSAPQVSVSPDGSALAVTDTVAGRVRLYDARTRAQRDRTLSDFLGDQPIAFSGDGSLLVYPAGADLVVRDARTLLLRKRLAVGPPFSEELTGDIPSGSIAVSADRHTVFYAYWLVNHAGQAAGSYLGRWSLPSGRRLPTIRLGPGPLLALRSVDRGSELVIVTAHDVDTYEARSLRRIRSEPIRPLPLLPSAAAISADGASVAIGSRTGSISFVNAVTGAASLGLGAHAAAVASTLYVPHNKAVVSVGDDGRVIAWNPATRAATSVLPGPMGHVRDAAVSPDGSTLYTAGVGGVLLAWDLAGSRNFGRSARISSGLTCCDPVDPPGPAMTVSPDGSLFAVPTATSTVGLFSTRTLRPVTSFRITPNRNRITALAWSPAGNALAIGSRGGGVQLWSVRGTPRRERSFMGLAPLPGQSESIQSLAFSPDGQLLAATDKNQISAPGHPELSPFAMLAIWHVPTGFLIGPPTSLGEGNGLGGSDVAAFSRNGRLLAATLLVGGIRVFDPSTGRSLRTLGDPRSDSVSLAFAPNGLLAAGTLGGTVEMWDPATGRRLGSPLLADSEPITSVAFDPRGQRFATTGYQDGTIKLWFTDGLQQLEPQLGSDHGATSTAMFDPAGDDLLVTDDHGASFTWPTSLAAWERRACLLANRFTSAAGAQLVRGARYSSLCP